MIELKEECFRIIDSFKFDYPELAERAEYCYPSGLSEITFIMDNKDRIAYDAILRKVHSVYIADVYDDCYGESEEECKRAFSEKLKRRMMLSGFNNSALADRVWMSPVIISQYVNGKTMPSIYTIRKLAWGLGCSISELMDF